MAHFENQVGRGTEFSKMNVDIPWRRKRPIEEEEYQEKKRFLSEEFFNMRISHTRNVWMEKATATRGDEVENIDREEVMEEARANNVSLLSSAAASASLPQPTSVLTPPSVSRMSSAASAVLSDDEERDFEELDVDTPAPRLSREKTPTNENTWSLTHPFQRRNSSMVDEKVEEMVRESRQRLMSETSSGPSPEHSRALIVYSPSPLPGSADNDEDGSGSDSSPPPRFHANGFQHAGSETSESGSMATARKPGIGGPREQSVTAGGVSHSADRGAGAASVVDDTEAMSLDEDGAEGVPVPVSVPVGEDTPEASTLTRMGTSRGRPTPYLTPEWAARARVAQKPCSSASTQEAGQEAVGPGSGDDLACAQWNGL